MRRSDFIHCFGFKPFRKVTPAVGLFLFGLYFSGCFNPKEGCLDPAAVNYFSDADKDCCCRYPQLVLNTDQYYDTLLYRQDSLYPDGQGHYFRIRSISLYLSGFQMLRGNEVFPMQDSTDFKIYNASHSDTLELTLTDDFLLLRRTPLENPVASFREAGTFDGIRFRIGLNQAAEQVIPTLAPTAHPLRPQTENLYRNGEYVFLQAVVVPDSLSTTPNDTLNFTRSDIGDLILQGSGSFYHETAFNLPITLHADWFKLFEGVNWTTHDIPAWKSRIVSNLPATFTVSQ